jgi:hypothetical protein
MYSPYGIHQLGASSSLRDESISSYLLSGKDILLVVVLR